MPIKSLYTKELGALVAASAKPAHPSRYHVMLGIGRKWSVVLQGNIRATRVFNTKPEAVEFAKECAKKIEGEVVVHKTTGDVDEWLSLAG